MIGNLIKWALLNRIVVLLIAAAIILYGIYSVKNTKVDAIPDLSENQAVLNIYTDGQALIQVGHAVKILAETAPENPIQGRIDFIEPFYREDSRTTFSKSLL